MRNMEVLKKTADVKNDRSGLITRRSEVRILPRYSEPLIPGEFRGFFFGYVG